MDRGSIRPFSLSCEWFQNNDERLSMWKRSVAGVKSIFHTQTKFNRAFYVRYMYTPYGSPFWKQIMSDTDSFYKNRYHPVQSMHPWKYRTVGGGPVFFFFFFPVCNNFCQIRRRFCRSVVVNSEVSVKITYPDLYTYQKSVTRVHILTQTPNGTGLISIEVCIAEKTGWYRSRDMT